MELMFEVTLDYGDEGPQENEASPTAEDVATAVRTGLEAAGFTSLDVEVDQL